MNINYYPILKWKKGEQEALKKLSFDTNNFYPIIEIIDECEPSAFFSALSNCFKSPIYFDVSRLDPEYLESFISYCSSHHIEAYPILYINDFYNVSLPAKLSKFAVKVPIPVDFQGPSFTEILSMISAYSDNINLILDAGEVLDSRTANSVYDFYYRTLHDNLISLCQFSALTVCLTSFPEQLSIDSGEDMSYKRYDILIFKKIKEQFKSTELFHKLHYSDYGVTKFTDTEIDFSRMKYGILPKVKYTTNTHYIVKKGEKDRINNIFTRSYIDIAREIVRSNYYLGESFSYGDKCIFEKADINNTKPGGATQWVTYCANHHLTVVMEQLSNQTGF